MTESVNRVNSALTQLLQHIEVSMWAEDVDPERAMRVLNRITFGTPHNHPAGNVEGLPDWAEALAALALQMIHQHLDAQDRDDPDGARLVVLALVRQVLQSGAEPIEQALRSE